MQDTPFGQYHTEEELLAMLESGDFSQDLSVDPEVPGDPIDTGGDEPYSGFSNSIIFTDGGNAGGVELVDFMAVPRATGRMGGNGAVHDRPGDDGNAGGP